MMHAGPLTPEMRGRPRGSATLIPLIDALRAPPTSRAQNAIAARGTGSVDDQLTESLRVIEPRTDAERILRDAVAGSPCTYARSTARWFVSR